MVQQVLARRKLNYRGFEQHKETYLLTGKIFCGKCGYTYTGNRKKSTGRRAPIVTYRCNNQARRTNIVCKNREVNRDYIESFVIQRIENSIFNRRMADAILLKFEEYLRKKGEEMSQPLRRLEIQMKEIDAKRENLLDILADGIERQQRKAILSKLEKLEDEKAALELYAEQERTALALEIPDRRELERCFQKARDMFRARSLDDMQRLVDLYVEKIIVHENEVEIILNLVPLLYRQSFTDETHTVSRLELKKREKKY